MRAADGGEVRAVRPLPGLPRLPGVYLHQAPGHGDARQVPQVRRPHPEEDLPEAATPTTAASYNGDKDEPDQCDFMTWDVPVKDNCPECGQTMFKKSGRGFKKPFCINESCPNFVPEEKRGGYRKKKTEEAKTEGTAEAAAETAAEEKPKKTKAAAKKTTEKKTAAKKTTAKKTTDKKTTATKKTTTKKTSTKKADADATEKNTAAKKTTTKKASTKKTAEQAEGGADGSEGNADV